VILDATTLQVTVAILLNNFVAAINAAEEEEILAATSIMKSKEMLRLVIFCVVNIC
jgi:hypothetical protein